MKITENAQVAIDKLIYKLETGDLSPIVSLMSINRKAGDNAPMAKWSFTNQLIAFFSTGSLDCRGYRQWSKVGRNVRKGEKASYIFAPMIINLKDEKGNKTDETRLIGFKCTPIFADHQTDGDEVPTFDYAPLSPPPLLEVAKSLGLPVNWSPATRGVYGSYVHQLNTSDGDRIDLHSEELEVWFHELGHAVHNRLGLMANNTKVEKEVVAELTASVLMSLYGIDNSGNAWSYIKHYSDKPLTAIKSALTDVSLIVNHIMGLTQEAI